MGVSIQLPTSSHTNPLRRRRFATRISCRVVNAVCLLLIPLFWFLGGVSWTNSKDENPLWAATMEPVIEVDLGAEIIGLKNLVIVTCHAIWLGGPTAGENETEWAIAPFQKGETATYIEHIKSGVEISLQDPESLLIFSGGETKTSAGPRSEAYGYFDLAVARGLLSSSLFARATTEESATDSYQNVLFSIARFHEVTGSYPVSITVISHGFKRDRFRQIHRVSLRYPEEKFRFVGIDPDWRRTISIREEVLESEGMTREAWRMDPYACVKDGGLRAKRRERNPWRRFNSYTSSCPELRGLLGWCGLREGSLQTQLYPGSLPWLK